jgi:hypothetical protein
MTLSLSLSLSLRNVLMPGASEDVEFSMTSGSDTKMTAIGKSESQSESETWQLHAVLSALCVLYLVKRVCSFRVKNIVLLVLIYWYSFSRSANTSLLHPNTTGSFHLLFTPPL